MLLDFVDDDFRTSLHNRNQFVTVVGDFYMIGRNSVFIVVEKRELGSQLPLLERNRNKDYAFATTA